MKNNILILTIFFLILNGCSSSSVKTDSERPVVDESVNAKKSVKAKEPEPIKPSKEVAQPESKKSSIGPSVGDLLTEAIKNQRDDDIYKYAGQTLLENPNDVRALNSMAIYHYKKGRFSAAEYLLRKAIASDNRSVQAHSNLGLIFMAQKERREAVVEFRKALEISPEDPVASANLGSIFIEEKDYIKAEIALENVYKKGWKDSKVLANYAVALAAVGKLEKSESIYKDLLKDQNSNREVLFNYAILQVELLKKNSEGLDTINRLKFIGPTGEMKKRLSQLEAKAKSKSGQEK